jgi:uncharacterized phage protein (TIGR02218 family)
VKSVSSNLANHTAGETTTLVTCWKITRVDAQVFRFTDHVENLPIGAETYLAATGYTASAVQSSADLAVDNLEIEGVLDSSTITEGDLLAGVWDFAQVEIFRVNYLATADGVLWLRKGRLGQIRLSRATFVAELRGLAQAMQQVIGEVYSPSCRANLGDTRCGVNLAPLTVAGTVTGGIVGRSVFADTARTEALGWFDGGLLTWTSGANAGRTMEVKLWTLAGTLFTLALPMVGTIAVGDAYTVYPGCQKRVYTDCRDKFNNIVNFRGEPFVPGEEAQWAR